jgi:hypothetical protein
MQTALNINPMLTENMTQINPKLTENMTQINPKLTKMELLKSTQS